MRKGLRGRVPLIALQLGALLPTAACGSYERSYAAGRIAGRVFLLLLLGGAVWFFLRRRR